MRSAWRSLRPGGVLLLTVPVGPDILVWNLHRRYGRLRLPLLLQGWEEVARFGWEEDRLSAPASSRRSYEPFFLLRRNGTVSQDLMHIIPTGYLNATEQTSSRVFEDPSVHDEI